MTRSGGGSSQAPRSGVARDADDVHCPVALRTADRFGPANLPGSARARPRRAWQTVLGPAAAAVPVAVGQRSNRAPPVPTYVAPVSGWSRRGSSGRPGHGEPPGFPEGPVRRGRAAAYFAAMRSNARRRSRAPAVSRRAIFTACARASVNGVYNSLAMSAVSFPLRNRNVTSPVLVSFNSTNSVGSRSVARCRRPSSLSWLRVGPSLSRPSLWAPGSLELAAGTWAPVWTREEVRYYSWPRNP